MFQLYSQKFQPYIYIYILNGRDYVFNLFLIVTAIYADALT